MEKGNSFSSAAVTDPTVKKLYRACMECVKLLEQNMKGKMDAHSLSGMTPVRNRLRECCEKLMFLNPLEFGRKADEILWRKCHYEPIRILRQQSEVLSSESRCYLHTMLTSAIGYYQLLLLKLQQAIPDNSSAISDFERSSISPIVRKGNGKAPTLATSNREKLREWFISERHRILIYQGDLARYLCETDSTMDIRTAQHYYHQALALKPFHGAPHNQLGTLFLSTNHGLDAAYYYLRSISAQENFTENAEGNLLTLLQKNEQALRQFLENNGGEQEPILDGTADMGMKYFALAFLAAIRVLYLDEPENNENGIVQQVCGRTIRSFFNALQYLVTSEAQSNHPDKGVFEFDLVVKVFVIQMLIIGKLQIKSSLKLSPAVALLLSMFSNFLNHVVNDFCDDLAKNGSASGDAPAAKPMDNEEQTGSVSPREVKRDSLIERQTPSRRPNLTRRRRRGEEDDEEENGDGHESDTSSEPSTRSENEMNGGSLGLMSSDSDVIEISDDEDLSLAKLVAQNGQYRNGEPIPKTEIESSQPDAAVSSELPHYDIERKPWIELNPSEKIELLSSYGLLAPLKVVCDWFRSNPNLVLMVQKIAGDLWSTFARLLNFLPDDRQLGNYLDSNSQVALDVKESAVSSLNEWVQKFPLPEDVSLRGIASLKQIHDGLDYSSIVCANLESETLVRICCIRSFGHHLIRLNTPGFRFDRARMEFISNNGQTIIQDSTENDKKNALMRSMAQLRLKGELAKAEQLSWIPVYLVPDANALCYKLTAVKKLASAQKFIIVIPTTTINELDRMKKDSGAARSATRWLEDQFRRGNKFVRVQKSTERDETLVVDGDVPVGFLEILKCASQLRKLVKAGTTSASTIVTIVTSFSKNTVEFDQMDKALQGAALPGINLVNASHLCTLWDSHKKRGS